MTFIICSILFWSCWCFAGQARSLQEPMLWLALIGLGIPEWRKVRRDPVFWLGAVLMIELCVQCFVAGRFSGVDQAGHVWLRNDIPWWMPVAVFRAEAKEMLVWFFPAWSIVLGIRHCDIDRSKLLTFILWNGAALAIFGLVQELCRASAMFWIWPCKDHFFAAFQYENNAGDFFLVMFCLAICRAHRWHVRAVDLALPGLFLVAVVAAGCRVTIGMAALVLVSLAVYGLLPARLRARPHLIPAAIWPLGLAAYWRWRPDVFVGVQDRWWQILVNLRVWLDHPAWGVGGWGCRYFPSLYMSADDQRMITAQPNNHCDPVQFLAEFGAVGFVCLAGILIALGASARPGRRLAWSWFWRIP